MQIINWRQEHSPRQHQTLGHFLLRMLSQQDTTSGKGKCVRLQSTYDQLSINILNIPLSPYKCILPGALSSVLIPKNCLTGQAIIVGVGGLNNVDMGYKSQRYCSQGVSFIIIGKEKTSFDRR